jgi:hypothetical protein
MKRLNIVADTGANRLDAVLAQLLDQGILLLIVHVPSTYGIYPDDDPSGLGLTKVDQEPTAYDQQEKNLLHRNFCIAGLA